MWVEHSWGRLRVFAFGDFWPFFGPILHGFKIALWGWPPPLYPWTFSFGRKGGGDAGGRTPALYLGRCVRCANRGRVENGMLPAEQAQL